MKKKCRKEIEAQETIVTIYGCAEKKEHEMISKGKLTGGTNFHDSIILIERGGKKRHNHVIVE